MTLYLFVDKKLKIKDVRDFSTTKTLDEDEFESAGQKAEQHRKKLGRGIIAFVAMAGDNPVGEIELDIKKSN